MSVSLTEINRMRTVEVRAVKHEGPTAKSIFFKDTLCAKAKAGQFVMVWIPDVDEIPLSLSTFNPKTKTCSVTVTAVGEATSALNRKSIGDLIGIRGPFGNHFEIDGNRALVVGGGIGIAPLMQLIELLVERHSLSAILTGARTRGEIIFLDRLERTAQDKIELIVTTDDGTYGIKGVVTDPLDEVLSSGSYDTIYSCGPEDMLYKVYRLAERYSVPLQVSLERIMRCAVGICGSCVIGPYRVCRDGPIFTSEQLREVEEEFGKYKHGFNGRRIPI
ncbi:MAG: dihydroorotate dehydrogenase electron transfer subunit [Candidatus Bathyarchaeia archaeon]